ncbi:hypothetical protein N7453_000445 [Penicillium expansum]|nr:hypothetical protein N7453_000445 [Penicillium expansum]
MATISIDTVVPNGYFWNHKIGTGYMLEFRMLKIPILCAATLIQNWRKEFQMQSPENHNLSKVRPITGEFLTSDPDRTEKISAWNEGGVLISEERQKVWARYILKVKPLGIYGRSLTSVILHSFSLPPHPHQPLAGACRIGQKKPVFVYRMIAGGTFEEKIYGMNIFKSQLAYRMVDKKSPVRIGLKSDDPYLARCTTSAQKRGIDKLALEQDSEMMHGLHLCESARLSSPSSSRGGGGGDRLTAAERQSVEDELRLRIGSLSEQ